MAKTKTKTYVMKAEDDWEKDGDEWIIPDFHWRVNSDVWFCGFSAAALFDLTDRPERLSVTVTDRKPSGSRYHVLDKRDGLRGAFCVMGSDGPYYLTIGTTEQLKKDFPGRQTLYVWMT